VWGIVSIGMRYTEQGWQCSRKQFHIFLPALYPCCSRWFVLDRLAYSLRQIKPLCRGAGFKEHVTPLISLASLACADQALGGASSCLMQRHQSWTSQNCRHNDAHG